jgi:Domain of unknown function (DUF4160)
MPTIAIFYGITIQTYWRDHAPPHVHAMYQGFEALIAIESGKLIGGTFPPSALRMVRQWVLLRKRQLRENWRCGRLREPFTVVPGPDENE